MPRDYPRSQRVERLAREVLSEAIHELKDPRIGFATVTGVKMTGDLRHAKVFVSVLGNDEERARSIQAVRHAAPHLRRILGQEIRMKYLPTLDIEEDTTAIQGEKIEAILREVEGSRNQSEMKDEEDEE